MHPIKVITFTIIVVDLVLVFFSLSKGVSWLLNSQLAFLSSLFVTLASFYSYRRLIQKRVESGVEVENSDAIEKIENPYDLYSEAEQSNQEVDLKAFIKEERAKQIGFKQSGQNLVKSAGGILNPVRLLSYLFLVVSFLYLVDQKRLELIPYLLGLFVVPLGALMGSLFVKK